MDLITEPWGWLLDGTASRARLRDDGDTPIDGTGSPRLVLRDGDRLRWSAHGGEAPIAGFPFIDRDQVARCMYHVPASHIAFDGLRDHELAWSCHGRTGHITQLRLAMRPKDGGVEHPGVYLDHCIQWAIHSFMDLAQSPLTDIDSTAGGLVRRQWDHARRIWLEPDPDEPRMELIIRLAQDANLREALESVAGHPRRILERIREQTPIGRVTEFDAACIRDYARRPGRTAFEKAGVTQRLLAVQRRASFDTLENRLTSWTLDELRRRSLQWQRRHMSGRSASGPRSKAVGNMSRLAHDLRHGEHLAEISPASLVHPVVANYPLQMEARYSSVYGAYQALLRYRRIQDEAWTWRRPLWCDTVRQLVACTLIERLGDPIAGSAPYYRTESERGRWIGAPSGPGPFNTPHGDMYVIDAHDAEQVGADWHNGIPGPWAAQIGMLGPDSLLWWPERNAVVVIWGHLWCGSDHVMQQHVDDAADAIQRFAQGMAWQARDRFEIAGIILSTDGVKTDVGLWQNARHNHMVVGLSIPMRIDTTDQQQFHGMAQDLSTGIGLAVKEVCR